LPHSPGSFSSAGDDSQLAINFDLSSSNGDDSAADDDSDSDDDDNDGDDDDNCKTVIGALLTKSTMNLRNAGDTIQDRPFLFPRQVKSHKADLQRMFQKRKAARRMKIQLKDELSLKVDLSDCSDDSYPDEEVDSDFDVSSDSDSESDSSSVISLTENVQAVSLLSPPSPVHLTSNQEKFYLDLFTKPKQNTSLAQRIRFRRGDIEKIGLNKRVQGIGDSFVLHSEARRSSLLANRARSHTKMQKRIEQRKTITMRPVSDADGNDDDDDVHSGHDTGEKALPSESTVAQDVKNELNMTVEKRPNHGTLEKLSSFELFNEKKAMMKKYTSHQSLRQHSLDAKRKESKNLLAMRVREKRKSGEFKQTTTIT
jgi:hypothetical protein